MQYKLKFIKKVLSVALITELILNPVLVPWTVYAQDVTPTATITETPTDTPTPTPDTSSQTQSEPTPTPQDTITPTPTVTSSSTTTTGDAGSSAISDTTANSTKTTVGGQVGSNGCTPSGSVSCPVDTTNSATNESSASASSTSGDNTTSNALGDGSINSGTSSASAVTTTDLNSNFVDATASATPTVSVTPTPGTSSVSTDNKADSKTTTTADSQSGGNDASGNGGNATVVSGDSVASAVAANFINTNVIGSNYRFLIYNIYKEENTTINLNEIWKEIESAMGENASIVPSEANTLAISIKNDANVNSAVSATATSGDNKANNNGGNAVIITGNSYASANLFNLINTNIIGANFVFVIINIFGTLNGDIVVPSQERFNESMAAYNQGEIALSANSVVVDNYARVEGSKALADANSGKNKESGSGNQTITTGNAYASATTIDVLNTTLSWENWMSFIINNFGSWTGSVKGWGDPTSSTQAAVNESTTLDHSTGGQSGSTIDATSEADTGSSSTDIQNKAEVTSDVSAIANSGGNEAKDNGGDTSISTGMAIALANVMNFINTNIFGGNFLFVFINLFGHWNGDFIVARPDLQITITPDKTTVNPGDEVNYSIAYVNNGYGDAENAVVNIVLPQDTTYLSSSVSSPIIEGTKYYFSVGKLLSKQYGVLTVKVKVHDTIILNSQANNSIFEKLKGLVIRPAFASNVEKNITTTALIANSWTESNSNNNSASTTITIEVPIDNSSTSSNTTNNNGIPKLEVTSSHNVGEYVYPGDTVTFFVTVKNTGDAKAKNVIVYQNIHDGTPDVVGTVALKVGDIDIGKEKKLTYGLTIPLTVIPEDYHSIIYAEGEKDNGDIIVSEKSITDFLVKSKNIVSLVESVNAKENTQQVNEGNILGESATTPLCKNEKNYLPYVISIIFGMLWFIEYLRRKKIDKDIKFAIKKE